jgi:large subunit ribosomal protein L13
MATTLKTFSPRPRDIERRWYVVDADGAVLGRLASEVAKILRGKHKPIFAPHADTGDHVIVVNARGTVMTGGKEQTKVYYRHSQYPGGLREISYARLLADRPVLAVEKAVRGMLPKNRLGRAMIRKLAVYEGPEHPHQAQRPVSLALGEVPKWEGLPAPKPPPPPKRSAERPAAGTTGTGARRHGASSEETPSRRRRATERKPTAKRSAAKASTAKRGTSKTSGAKGETGRRAGRSSASSRTSSTASTSPKTSGRRSKNEKES